MTIFKENMAGKACQVMANIRLKEEMSYTTMAAIFKDEIHYDDARHSVYFLGFFEECYPYLIKQFMKEQHITRQQILNLFAKVSQYGETRKFSQAVANGEF